MTDHAAARRVTPLAPDLAARLRADPRRRAATRAYVRAFIVAFFDAQLSQGPHGVPGDAMGSQPAAMRAAEQAWRRVAAEREGPDGVLGHAMDCWEVG
jgi:hypothetical protein